MNAAYDLDKIKFATDGPTLRRAFDLYNHGKVTQFGREPGSFTAIVLGGQPYRVSVSTKHFDQGYCNCYLGENDTLCKHMVAVAICAVMDAKPLTAKDKQINDQPVSSGQLGKLNKTAETNLKKSVTTIIQKYIKAYEGPSRIWFRYQNRLEEGCNRLAALVSELPVSEQTAALLITMLLSLDKKLSTGGVDDSNGTVGGFMEEVVLVLKQYTELDPSCIKALKQLNNQETCFGWEEPLVQLLK